MITISLLHEYPETILTLASWFRKQWPDYFAQQTQIDVERTFRAEANRETLPIRLVAFVSEQLAGTITLRQYAISSMPQYQPGLGGLCVTPEQRNQAVGSALVKAGMNLARLQGFESIYATTVTADGILLRLGWHLHTQVTHNLEQLALYHYEFPK